jgi:tRNA(Ile)-lysidine synthase
VSVTAALERFLDRNAPTSPGDLVVVAFSGGTDSTALLCALVETADKRGLRLRAAHLDHRLDPDSSRRERQAVSLAGQLGVPITVAAQSVPENRRAGESPEAAARRLRYSFLEGLAQKLGARYIAVAHNADDQRETVLLRLLFGSGLAGLSGIPARRGRIVRPLLSLSRATLQRFVAQRDLEPVEDPTNGDLSIPRNRVRHLILPRLSGSEPEIAERLSSLAAAADRAITVLDRRLRDLLSPRLVEKELWLERGSLERLPSDLLPHGLAALHRLIGAPPPSRRALSDLTRQLRRGRTLGCDLGNRWRIEEEGEHLVLRTPYASLPPFAYTLTVPGEIRLPELGIRVCLSQRSVERWMFRGSRQRAGLSIPLVAGDRVTVRSRRPGDRIQPLGCSYMRRLKDVLIDRKVPRRERSRLPLLCVNHRIVWVPGVTIDHQARIRDSSRVWVAEIEAA